MTDFAQLHFDCVPEPERPPTLQERFEAFHAQNPHIYQALVELARDAKAQGHTRVGGKALWERLRWRGAECHGRAYRLNNSFVAPLVRRIVANEPDLADLFELRARRRRRSQQTAA
jgi:hypothetical protein